MTEARRFMLVLASALMLLLLAPAAGFGLSTVLPLGVAATVGVAMVSAGAVLFYHVARWNE